MATPNSLAVELRDVHKSFGTTKAVAGLSLTAQPAQVLALLGPNGAGKTTTIEMCEGFFAADAGSVRVLGLDPIAQSDELRSRIGVMLQGGGAYPAARAAEMLNLIAKYSANPLDPDWLLDVLGLNDARRTPYRRLSGGQQQRLSLACALVGRPELVFLDEPTAGMDAHARLLVWELVDRLRRDGVSVVLTTHLLDEAEELADHLVIIDRGSVVTEGTPSEVTSVGSQGQLTFRSRPELELTELLARLPHGFTAMEPAPGSYLLTGEVNPHVVAALTSWCAELGALATNLQVGQRSLEEVFLDLTGRELR